MGPINSILTELRKYYDHVVDTPSDPLAPANHGLHGPIVAKRGALDWELERR